MPEQQPTARALAPGLRARRAPGCRRAARARHAADDVVELAELTTRFAQNVLHDESSWRLELRERSRPGRTARLRACRRARQAALDRVGWSMAT
jgi:peptidyl-dipeptidase Dcp